jgi:hypothetical protein
MRGKSREREEGQVSLWIYESGRVSEKGRCDGISKERTRQMTRCR